MKLRLRSFESKETLKVDVPNSCSFLELKQILSQTLTNGPQPASIRLSLNRRDELQPTSPNGEDSLQSLGITAGDLVFFSVDGNPVLQTQFPQITTNLQSQSPQSVHNPQPEALEASNSHNIMLADSNFVTEDTGSSLNAMAEAESSEGMNSGDGKWKAPDVVGQRGEAMDYMEVDDGNGDSSDGSVMEAIEKSSSVPGFLRKVFTEELGDDGGRDHKLTVIAIHAVLLESGFVPFDVNSNEQINGFQFQAEWPSTSFMLSLFYTLPEIVSLAGVGDPIDSVVLKFQSLGKFINVYGSLANGAGQSGAHWVRLNEDQLVSFLNVVWANCGLTENISGSDGRLLGTSPEKEVFTFWRNVKDNLALPLLIDLCEKTGFQLPPCFMILPTELKLKIMELLPGVDVAKVSCACSELQYLASSDDLWKLKFTEQFGAEGVEARGSWKKAFVRTWKNRKLASRRLERTRVPRPHVFPWIPRIRGGIHDIVPPGVVGGDYDRMPLPFGDQARMIPGRRRFSPNCNLEERMNFI